MEILVSKKCTKQVIEIFINRQIKINKVHAMLFDEAINTDVKPKNVPIIIDRFENLALNLANIKNESSIP